MADHPAEPVSQPPIRAEIAGNRLEVIETGAARLQALLKLIGNAQHSFKMLMYMFNADHAGDRVRDALVAAARRGVEVRLLVDGFGSGAPADFFQAIDEEDETEELASLSDAAEALRLTAAAPPRPTPSGGDYE